MPDETTNGAMPENTPTGTADSGNVNPEGTGGAPSPTTTPGENEPGSGAGDHGTEIPEFIEKDGQKFYRSFDAHPKWRELQDTNKAVRGILEEKGYNDISDLVSDLNDGATLAELLGTRDAAKVQEQLDKAKRWEEAEEYWAEQEEAKLREGETKDETLARYEKQLKEERAARQNDRQQFEEDRATEEQLARFNHDLTSVVDRMDDLSDNAKAVLKLHLGVNNPMDELDITDRKGVRDTAQSMATVFSDLIKAERQNAVDAYVRGQSTIVPTPPAGAGAGGGSGSVSNKAVEVKEGMSDEEAFEQANLRLTETLTKMWDNSQSV